MCDTLRTCKVEGLPGGGYLNQILIPLLWEETADIFLHIPEGLT